MITVPAGGSHAPVPDAVIAAPSGNAIHRRFFAPSDHSSLTKSYGTRPACGTGRPAAPGVKHPVASTVAGGAAAENAQPAIDARASIPSAASAGPLNRATC